MLKDRQTATKGTKLKGGFVSRPVFVSSWLILDQT